MNPIALSPRLLPTRITGPVGPWIRDGALVGLATGYIGPAAVAFGWTFHPWLLACALSFASGGALLGLAIPAALERVRGRVPLPILALLIPMLALPVGAAWAAAAAAMVGAPVALAATFGAVALAVLLGLFWFPYTVQAVLGGPRWPIVAAASVLAPPLGFVSGLTFLALGIYV